MIPPMITSYPKNINDSFLPPQSSIRMNTRWFFILLSFVVSILFSTSFRCRSSLFSLCTHRSFNSDKYGFSGHRFSFSFVTESSRTWSKFISAQGNFNWLNRIPKSLIFTQWLYIWFTTLACLLILSLFHISWQVGKLMIIAFWYWCLRLYIYV